MHASVAQHPHGPFPGFFGECESQLGRLRNEAELASASPVLAYMLAYTQGT
jgi:hypothetical protein